MEWVSSEYRPSNIDANCDIHEFRIREMLQMSGPPKWAVRLREHWVWTKHGRWEYQPQPSSRTKAFLRRARYDTLNEAMRAAEIAIQHIDD